MLEIIKNSAEDDIIAIDATGDTIIKKEVFDAIKGTDRIIHIESNGIEWIFDGQDIKETKDIDVSLNVFYDYNYPNFEHSDVLGKALFLEFADNGDLPAAATIRVKLDYTLREYVGERVYIYYYDEETKDEQILSDVIGQSLEISEQGWFEFKINHNSTYIMTPNITNSKITKKDKVLIEQEELDNEKTNNKPSKKEKSSKTIIIGVVAVVTIAIGVTTFIVLKNKKKKQ